MDLSKNFKTTILILFVITIMFQLINSSFNSRRKRQFSSKTYLPKTYIIRGEENSFNLSYWNSPSECSRSCGGGVLYQTKQCLPQTSNGEVFCQGGKKKFYSCNIQDCPKDEPDFRAQQCSHFDNISFLGIHYAWIPFINVSNPCELNCMPKDKIFYYKLKNKVIDGTRCNNESLNICVDGKCEAVGCDMMLGSLLREDKCLKCSADAKNCQTLSGIFDMNDLQEGYNDILYIPSGATNIDIHEILPSNNYLACRNLSNHYFLNGDWRIDFSGKFNFAGTWWQYDKKSDGFPAPGRISTIGPTTDSIYIVLLYQDRNPGIQYEYSIPYNLTKNESFAWNYTAFGSCSSLCIGGYKTREVICNSRLTLLRVTDNLCDLSLKPHNTQQCGLEECPPHWSISEWGKCTKLFEEDGEQNRTVQCEKTSQTGISERVADSICLELGGNKPSVNQKCIPGAEKYLKFIVGPWTPCDKPCGEGKQIREIFCIEKQENGSRFILLNKECSEKKPKKEQTCMVQSCKDSTDISSSTSEIPFMETEFKYESSDTYGSTIQVVDNESMFGKVTDDEYLPTNKQQSQTESLEASTKSIADNCQLSIYGCCPDGKTPAHGPYMEGCCLMSPFGCCPDNINVVRGPNNEGCDCNHSPYGCCSDQITPAHGSKINTCDCEQSQFGCCPDKITPAGGEKFDGCPCHTTQFGCCPDGITTPQGPHLYGCHCSQTEHKCCPDKKTFAKGPNFEGCTCAEREYECCPDGVSNAEGTKFEGCANVTEPPQKACALPKETGSCNNFVIRYFFDTAYGSCSRFWYSGCERNANNYETANECKEACEVYEGKELCLLPKSNGPCPGYQKRWYYNSETNECAEFVYGGCFGNTNRFNSLKECLNFCAIDESLSACDQPLNPGPCEGKFERWYYDKPTDACRQFNYGGCKGNQNNYRSEHACKYSCKKAGFRKEQCLLPKENGNLSGVLARWYYSEMDQKCMPFYYTGTGGNKNNYESLSQCVEKCPKQIAKTGCEIPAEIGECHEYVARWYYDIYYERCRQFYWGSCGGNENNFADEESCTRRCEKPPTKNQSAEEESNRDNYKSKYYFNKFKYNLTDSCFFEPNHRPCIPPISVIHLNHTNNYNIGSEVSMVCIVDGAPTPNVIWTKNNVPIISSENVQIHDNPHRLVLYNVQLTDKAEYGCTAINILGNHTNKELITIKSKADVQSDCFDNPYFANCELIVKAKYCFSKYYKKFCCKSCVQAGQIANPNGL